MRDTRPYHNLGNTCTSCVFPGLILPGHQAMAGSLIPPSHVVPFPHRSRPALPANLSWIRAGLREDGEVGVIYSVCHIVPHPLSEVKKTNVLLATPVFSSAVMTSPTPQSRLASESPNGPLSVVLVNCSEAN